METIDVTLISLDEFMELYSDEGPFELIDGERISVSPQVTRSGRIAGRLFRFMANHSDENELGEVFSEVPFVITPQLNWVKGSRVPDIMFIRAERLAVLAESDPEWEEKPLTIVPDLVVEVVSPTDRLTKVNRKISRYLKDGVLVIWLVDADSKTVTIYKQGQTNLERLTVDDMLSGGEIIPGFEVAVSKLF
ncbi:MAG: Uma2 family endonuclease [Chloroflexi bacterium]|nr:Uma2 family endonuclease [Chloroflexota bacterium]